MTDNRRRPRTSATNAGAAPMPKPADASMLLLNEVMHTPVDPGYAEAKSRKMLGMEPPRRFRTTMRVTVIAVLLGFAAATATVALRAPQPDVVTARRVLEQEIRDRRASNEELSDSISDLNAEVEQIQTVALSESYPVLLANLGRDAGSTGALAVKGPGVTVKLRDGAKPQDDSPAESSSRVQDYDIQVVVNSLWASGAEAISVNGQRLTARSAIRSAGDAILVDLVGLIGPYEIEAIGDPATLPTYFSRSIGQSHLSILGSRYGISSSVDQADQLQLSAGQSISLFHASVPEELELQQPDATARTTRESNK